MTTTGTASTAVSGWGLCAMGATALITAAIAMRQPGFNGWLAAWLVEAPVAFTIALFSMHWKASRWGTDLFSTAGRRLLMGMLPALVAGGPAHRCHSVGRLHATDPRRVVIALRIGRGASGRIVRADSGGAGRSVYRPRRHRPAHAVAMGQCPADRRFRTGKHRLRSWDCAEIWWLETGRDEN